MDASKLVSIQRRSRAELASMPKPESPAELEVLSRWYFGTPLHLKSLWVTPRAPKCPDTAGGQYAVREPYNDYHGKGWLWGQCENAGYDYSAAFWRHVIGELYCGGIAECSYGQATVIGRRNIARLQRFEECLRRKESGRLRKAFERLAREYGAGENTGTMDNGVLTAGRVDGADAASMDVQQA
jgi:hypothetical protein